tara:strand:- start:3841 stop:4677 length:837 start_codon:yes stop_codon:yes gene_type:complete
MNIRRKQNLGTKMLVFLFMFCSINLYYRSFVLKTYAEEAFINPLEYIYKSAKLKTESKNYEEAIRNYSKIIELSPYDLEAYLLRAKVYERINNYDLAYSDYSLLMESRIDEYKEIAYLYGSFILQKNIKGISDSIDKLNIEIKNKAREDQTSTSMYLLTEKTKSLDQKRYQLIKKAINLYSQLKEIYKNSPKGTFMSNSELEAIVNSEKYCWETTYTVRERIIIFYKCNVKNKFTKNNKDYITKITIINSLQNDLREYGDAIFEYNQIYINGRGYPRS